MSDTTSENNTTQTEEPSWESWLSTMNGMADKDNTASTGQMTRLETLKKWGFEQAVAFSDCPHEKLKHIISKHEEELEAKIRLWKNIYDSFRERFSLKISKAEEEAKAKQEEKSETDEKIKLLKEERDQLLKELITIREGLYKIREELAKAKQDIVEKWMDEAEKEIQKAVSIQKTVYNETRAINEQQYKDEKKELDIRIDQMKKMRQYYEERLDEVHKKLKIIGGEGLNPFATNMLIGLGTSAAGAAGFFFSVFTYTASFGNQDVLYYLLNGLMQSSNNSALNFLQKSALLIIVLALITGISGLCNWLINRLRKKDKNTQNDKFRHNMRTKFSYEGTGYFSNLKAGSWYSFWLNMLPAFALIGFIMLILSLNKTNSDQINALNSSNEGLIFGAILGLGIAAILYLYILKIIEPRLARRQEDPKNFHNWIRNNWELAACVILFVFSTASAIFNYSIAGSPSSPQLALPIALLFFLSSCFVCAFPIAYGVRFRGMMATGQHLERNIYYLDNLIASASGPEIPDINIDYASKMQEMINDLLSIVQQKALLLRGITGDKLIPVMVSNDSPKERRLFKYLRLPKLKNIFKGSEEQETDTFYTIFKLAEWERKYFPDYDERLKVVEANYRDKENEIKEADKKIEQLKTDLVNKKLAREAEIEKIRKQIDSWKFNFLDSLKTEARQSEVFKTQHIEEVSSIMDGFHLGIWYRENQLGPIENYFKSCVNFKMNGHPKEPVSQ
jgi:hypothetical protein